MQAKDYLSILNFNLILLIENPFKMALWYINTWIIIKHKNKTNANQWYQFFKSLGAYQWMNFSDQ